LDEIFEVVGMMDVLCCTDTHTRVSVVGGEVDEEWPENRLRCSIGRGGRNVRPLGSLKVESRPGVSAYWMELG